MTDATAARAVVRAHLIPTPMVGLHLHLPGRGATALAKLETLQPTGAFKVRGALAAAIGR